MYNDDSCHLTFAKLSQNDYIIIYVTFANSKIETFATFCQVFTIIILYKDLFLHSRVLKGMRPTRTAFVEAAER